MGNEFRHADVLTTGELTEAEHEGIGTHVFNSQATGDILYASSATQLSRLAAGTQGYPLVMGASVPQWGGAHLILGAADTSNLGGTGNEIANIYVGTAGGVYFGLAQEFNLKHILAAYTIAGGDVADLNVNYVRLSHAAQKSALSLWNTNKPPLCPETAVEYALPVYGDVLIGDIWVILENPIAIGRRQTTLSTAILTTFYSNRDANVDGSGGAFIGLASDEAGAVNSGYVTITAYGQGTGALANSILLRTRSGVGTVAERAKVSSTEFTLTGLDLVMPAEYTLKWKDTGGVARNVMRAGHAGDPVTFWPLKSAGVFQWNDYANSRNNMVLNDAGALNVYSSIQIASTKVIGARVIDARIDDVVDSTYGAEEAGVLDALRDAAITHGWIAAA